jgi:hypothetical protein
MPMHQFHQNNNQSHLNSTHNNYNNINHHAHLQTSQPPPPPSSLPSLMHQQHSQPPPSLMQQQQQKKNENLSQEAVTFSIPGSEQFTSNPLLNIKPISELMSTNSKSNHTRNSLNESTSSSGPITMGQSGAQPLLVNTQKEIKFEEPRKNSEPIDYNESVLLNKHFNNGNPNMIRNENNAPQYSNRRSENGFTNNNYNGRYSDSKNHSNYRDYNGNGDRGRDTRASYNSKTNEATSRRSNERQSQRQFTPERDDDKNRSPQRLNEHDKKSTDNSKKVNVDSPSKRPSAAANQDSNNIENTPSNSFIATVKIEETSNKSQDLKQAVSNQKIEENSSSSSSNQTPVALIDQNVTV